jgi:hypothetical protein
MEPEGYWKTVPVLHGTSLKGHLCEKDTVNDRVLTRIAGVVAFIQSHLSKKEISIISWSKLTLL